MKRTPGLTEPNEFEIYQSEIGYVAVTNEVRRKILTALAKRERQLSELVTITGKAKPTLSNLHMRELLAQKIIEETPHPTDQRRKIYRLTGTRIGSSSVPIEKLRGAVKQYVTASPMAHAITIQQVFDVLLEAGESAHGFVALQGRKLGETTSGLFAATDPRDLVARVAAYWEREGITRTAKIDLEHLALEVEVNPRYASTRERIELSATLLGGFFEGILATRNTNLHATARVQDDRVLVAAG